MSPVKHISIKNNLLTLTLVKMCGMGTQNNSANQIKSNCALKLAENAIFRSDFFT